MLLLFALSDESWITIVGMVLTCISGIVTLVVNSKVNRIETRSNQNVGRLESLKDIANETRDISADTLQAAHEAKHVAAESKKALEEMPVVKLDPHSGGETRRQ